MGVDISTNTGVCFSQDEMLDLITEENREMVIELITSFGNDKKALHDARCKYVIRQGDANTARHINFDYLTKSNEIDDLFDGKYSNRVPLTPEVFAKLREIANLDNCDVVCCEDSRTLAAILPDREVFKDEIWLWEAKALRLINYDVDTVLPLLAGITEDSTLEDLRNCLDGVVDIRLDGFDSYVEEGEFAVELWNSIITFVLEPHLNSIRQDDAAWNYLPFICEVVVIGSPRYEGWDLEVGTAYFVFEERACFEKIPTKQGEILSALMGSPLSLKSWSTYSV
jgi:hypothetical protein